MAKIIKLININGIIIVDLKLFKTTIKNKIDQNFVIIKICKMLTKKLQKSNELILNNVMN